MKAIIHAICFLSTMLTFSCSDDLEEPSKVASDDILKLTVNKNVKNLTTVLVRVPKDAGQIDVTFTTSGGFFSFNSLRTIKQFTDSIAGDYRYTRTELRPDTTKGPVYITAETTFARRRVDIKFVR
jgi:hypothetical protein